MPGRSRTLLAALAATALLVAGCADAPSTAPAAKPTNGNGQGNGNGNGNAYHVDINAVKAADAAAVLSPLAFQFIAEPWPVVGADGKRHYAYELIVENQLPGTATLQSVQALDAASKAPLGPALTGSALVELLRINPAPTPTNAVLPPGASARLFMDVAQDPGQAVPRNLTHRISMSWVSQGSTTTQTIAFTGVTSPVVQQAPVVVSPPLRGDGWIMGNGCCSPINAHRGSTLSIDGTIRVAQRFAIDMVQLTPSGNAVTGDPSQLTSYPAFGKEIHAAASGTVVIAHDGEPEQPPGELRKDATLQNADGNYLVIDIGHGLYTFYAHMQPGSQRVKEGDRVKVGQVLGLLGNTGNTDAPHLHFHVMDGPSPLSSNGVPFVFDGFTGTGLVTDMDAIQHPVQGQVVPVDPTVDAGAHHDQLPLNAERVTFPS